METCPRVDEELKRRLREVCPTLVLASQSPNRRRILEDAGVNAITRPQDIWEICGLTEPEAVVMELSRQKFQSYLDSSLFDPSLPAIAVDTLVCLDGKLLGKPKDEAEAEKMLRSLSGRWHADLRILIDITVRVTRDCDRLGPGFHVRRNAVHKDGRAEDRAV